MIRIVGTLAYDMVATKLVVGTDGLLRSESVRLRSAEVGAAVAS